MKNIKLTVTEPQAAFHALTCRYPAFIAGYGAGKSETLLNQAIMDATESPHALIGIYAPTYDLINLIIAARLIEKLTEMGIAHTYRKQEKIVTCHGGQLGSFVLRSLDKPEGIVGYETYRAHIDELDTLKMDKAEDAWNKIISRNRQIPKGMTKDTVKNRVCAYSTPEGFKFCYKRWGLASDNSEYQMIKASTYSNPWLPESYITSLKATYPEELIEAYINGEFVNLTAGTVYKNYVREVHVSVETIRENETLYIGCDFNVTKQAATIFVRRNGGSDWHAVAELVDMYDTPEMIDIIKAKYEGHRIIIYPDASGNSRKSVNASTSDIALLKQSFEVRVNRSNPRVKDRVLATNKAFSDGALFINDRECPTVARCLEQQAYNKNGEPDKSSGNDHQNDATTYPIVYERPIRKPIARINVGYVT